MSIPSEEVLKALQNHLVLEVSTSDAWGVGAQQVTVRLIWNTGAPRYDCVTIDEASFTCQKD